MKKKILNFLLTLCIVTAFVPIKAFAEGNEQSSKTTITTVNELLQFVKAVNDGEYDGKKDAVVSLDADLDLTGVVWTNIGCTDEQGEVKHCFGGKFYGNGHSVSNLDYSSVYGKDVLCGFFGVVDGAEISGLTVKGSVNVSPNSDYSYFGTIAGYAVNSKISDCVSEVEFNNNGKYVYGTVGMCGYAENTVLEFCRNKGSITITGDMGSLYVGGIVGYATGISEICCCANTADITVWASHAGTIAGELAGNSKITNCYSVGKFTPLGKGTADAGGIVGTVGSSNTVSGCYFGGEIDLSQYTGTLPYKRFGGIVGKSQSGAVYEKNFFAETENVSACGNNDAAGTAKTLEYMKTEAFYNEINAGGNIYRFNPNGTPLLSAAKYTVSFVVMPDDLTNVVIKVNGNEISDSVDLEAGTYFVEVSADNCELFGENIVITADTATHVQTLAMTYLPADYSRVDKAVAAANALNKDEYKDFLAVETAVNAVVRGKNITEQAVVDAMAKAIEDAIAALEKKVVNTNSEMINNSPQTGDNGKTALWIEMLLASGAALTGTTVIGKKAAGKKRKYNI